MKVLDHTQVSRDLAKRRRRAKLKKILPIVFFGLVAAVLIVVWQRDKNNEQSVQSPQSETSNTSAETTEEPKVIRTFQPEEFKALYNSFSYPQTTQIESPPAITGDAGADAHIQSLAEARGYQLRSLPVSGQLELVSEDITIQKLALKPLQDLIAASTQAGSPLSVTAAFRDIEIQQELFVNRLADQGVGAENIYFIMSGQADDAINAVLATTAPPGYSRHHTGYTVDFQCGSSGLDAFEFSECYTWLAQDNYAISKSLGWIPSYPKGASLQGPEPEPWEYIWVGVDALYE